MRIDYQKLGAGLFRWAEKEYKTLNEIENIVKPLPRTTHTAEKLQHIERARSVGIHSVDDLESKKTMLQKDRPGYQKRREAENERVARQKTIERHQKAQKEWEKIRDENKNIEPLDKGVFRINHRSNTGTQPVVQPTTEPIPIIKRTPTNTQTTSQANQLRIVPAATVEATNSTSQVAAAVTQTPGASGATTEEISGFWNSFGKAGKEWKGASPVVSNMFAGMVTGSLVGGVSNLANVAGADSVSGSGFLGGAVKGAMIGAGLGLAHRAIGTTGMIRDVNQEFKGLGGFTKSLAEMAPNLTSKSSKVVTGALTVGASAFATGNIHPSTRPVNRMNY